MAHIFEYFPFDQNLEAPQPLYLGSMPSPKAISKRGGTPGMVEFHATAKTRNPWRGLKKKNSEASWWFQPLWKVLVKLKVFPK